MMQMIIPAYRSSHLVCTECGNYITKDIAILNEGKMICFHCWVSKPHEDINWDDQVVLIKEK